MLGVRDVLDYALGAFDGNQTRLAEALGVKGPTVNRWYAGKNGIDFESCLRLARVTGLPAAEVLLAAGHDPHLIPVTSANTPAEARIVARQQSLRAQLERWTAVVGQQMGEEAAENYFWESLKRHADAILDVARIPSTAVNAGTEGAVNAAVSGRVKRGRNRRSDDEAPLTRSQHRTSAHLDERRVSGDRRRAA